MTIGNMKQESNSQIIIYQSESGQTKIEARLENETVWLTQPQMAELFQTTQQNISQHVKNIHNESELLPEATHKKFLSVRQEGTRKVQRTLDFYNLDMIISVGYRVKSHVATQFRIWATERLKEYIIKGFTMDDERLKNPNRMFGEDYFEEQLARIRDIRSSERRFYQKITDIYAACSADYDKTAIQTKQFFATIQNKLHWAITQQTAAEIIHCRADSQKQNMGLSSWKNAPDGPIRKPDVSIAKNYLNEEELDSLNRIVSMYLDYAEMQAKNRNIMHMQDWIQKLDAFLKFNEKEILTNPGKISAEIAKNFAESEFEKYHIVQDRLFESDFDQVIKQLKQGEKKNDV